MNPQSALENYTRIHAQLDEHIKENKAVFDAHNKIAMQLIDADNALRDAVAESGQPISNALFKVTYTPQTQTIYDEEKLRAALASNPAILEDAIKTIERPARITISKL